MLLQPQSYAFATPKLCFCNPKAMLLQPQSYAFVCRTLVFVKINAYFSRRIERLIVTKNERYYTPISNFSPQKAIKLNSKSIKLTNWVKRVRVIRK